MQRKAEKGSLKSGDTFHIFRKKYHYVGTIMDGGEELTVLWRWNRYSRSREYVVKPSEIFWEGFRDYAEP